MPYEFRVNDRNADGRKGGLELTVLWRGEKGNVAQAIDIEFKHLSHGIVEDEPTMTDDFGSHVEEFLQGALDAAWKLGLRPSENVVTVADLRQIDKAGSEEIEKRQFHLRRLKELSESLRGLSPRIEILKKMHGIGP